MSDAVLPSEENSPFIQACFDIQLNVPVPPSDPLASARLAIRREYRDSAKWKRLRCRKVRLVSQAENGAIYELTVGHAVEFDWTWEGSIAFRPVLVSECEDSEASLFLNGSLDPEIVDSILWTGEVLEVDEATSRIFIVVSHPEHRPRCGTFYVRPFEFLAFLNAVYNEPEFESIRSYLPARLAATTGCSHPDVVEYTPVGLAHLQPWWKKGWSILWGPPGTGKTYTTGQQVARALADPFERILVVSTTNRATDAVALAIGRAAQQLQLEPTRFPIRRIGKGAALRAYETADLLELLAGTETDYLAKAERLANDLAKSETSEHKALIRQQIHLNQRAMRDAAKRNFLDIDVSVVTCTAFRAMTFLRQPEVKQELENGHAPFTTVFIDEAGLLSRVAVAALSLLASRRVVLVGDSKQLAPISRISRIVEPEQGNWLACSSLSHLTRLDTHVDGVHVLREQHRMHADICEVVSNYQYGGCLTTALAVKDRSTKLPACLQNQPRAIWYVLDEEGVGLAAIRAERGPGNRSWVRPVSRSILTRLFNDEGMRSANGMYITPFTAQAKEIHTYLARRDMDSWTSSTVHSQQGSEADIVIFDSVNAGSYAWPYDEWQRLVNVALSRARESIIVLASRAEMEEPYLRPLRKLLTPRIAKRSGSQWSWREVPATPEHRLSAVAEATMRHSTSLTSETTATYRIGTQLEQRKQLKPVLSHEQQRLCGQTLDGKPRLVRGVAGSGKTAVLAHWLMKTVERLQDDPQARIWAVFANRSLQSLIADSIVSAWEKESGGRSFPWLQVELHHIRDVLKVILPDVDLRLENFEFDYDAAACAFLTRKPAEEVIPRCDALFIDEAQDMGPHALKLLTAMVRRTDSKDANSRSVNIFYDNAQNIYGRSTPKWSDIGLDMRGRSTVMKESFRSTQPITEFALNVLYQLQPSIVSSEDHRELVSRGLIEHSLRNEMDWWTVRFNQIGGPKPIYRRYATAQQEFTAIGDYCRELIGDQGVSPADICLLYNGRHIPDRLRSDMLPRLAGLDVELSVQTQQTYRKDRNTLLVTTPHSFKGHEAEIVIIPAVEQFVARGHGVLGHTLYVAMTRARSMLAVFSQSLPDQEARQIYHVLTTCLGQLSTIPSVLIDHSPQDDLLEILEQIGEAHRSWLSEIMARYKLNQEPIVTPTGEVVAEPLFSFRVGQQIYACFGTQVPDNHAQFRLEEAGIKLITPGDHLA